MKQYKFKIKVCIQEKLEYALILSSLKASNPLWKVKDF
jgi:hypothetical protein